MRNASANQAAAVDAPIAFRLYPRGCEPTNSDALSS